MKKRVMATVLCAAIMAIAVGFAAVAQTANASLKPEGDFKSSVKATNSAAASGSDVNGSEWEDDSAEEVTNEIGSAAEEKVSKAAFFGDATPSGATHVSDEEGLKDALQESGTIILDEDIQVTKPLYVTAGAKIAIDGADHRIYSGENPNLWGILWVSENAEVSLQNITIDATGMDCGEKLEDGRYHDYYAILTKEGTKLTIKEGTNIICNDREESIEIKNQRKGGIFLNGNAVMNGGEISGFYIGGITVGDTAQFVLEDGTISNIRQNIKAGAGGINVLGNTTVNGGTLSENTYGIFNNGHLTLNGGEITGNRTGIYNNNEDGITHEQFKPVVDLKGGTIAGNTIYGIQNCEQGTLIFDGTNVSDEVMGTEFFGMGLFAEAPRNAEASILISNETGSKLEIHSGSIVSNSPNGIAVYNDDQSEITMTGGTIAVNGADSVAIKNDNPQKGSVVLQGGSTILGSDSKTVVTGSGNTTVGDEFAVDAGDRVKVKGISTGNGSVTPTLTYANIGDTINFTIKANSDYRVSDVKVNGVSVGAVSQYTLTVTGEDVLEAQFVYVSSSGGSSHSGGSGGSGGSFASSSATKPSIPETPGAWVQDQTGWKFASPNQIPYVNTWIRSKNQWYWVGEDSYMKTGWNQIADKWYYLTPVTGEMKTGWLQDGDIWYYLDETGARKTGWLQDGTKWYYLNQDGTMAANTVTPDGYKVDGSGAWVQ